MINYSYGPYNKFNETEQWIRITEGCPHHHPYCYEPQELKVFGIPNIVRNKVKIMDMNLLCKPEAERIISELGFLRVDGKVVYYELICGIDYRFLTSEIAKALRTSRFQNIRIAWDWWYKNQYAISKAIKMLFKAGYKNKELMIFMICNWKISYQENLKKLELCKVWNVKVSDCWFDNQVSPNIKPIHWLPEEIKSFRHRVRKHNQLVTFGMDPEITPSEEAQEEFLI
jgi:PIN domain nuclease of toxin-antitoxin system